MRPTRRRYLLGLSVGVTGALSGCSAAIDPPGGTPTAPAPGDDAPTGVELPLPASELKRVTPRDAIPAITEPAFGDDWGGISIRVRERVGEYTTEPRLRPDDLVIGVTHRGDARAYPLAVLNWHEIVNDDFGGPLLVTYCPLCRSGLVAERRVGGEETVFGVSGLLWNENLVMYDRATDSLWSQLLGKAVRGPRSGDALRLLPSTLTTWGAWTAEFPDTDVLLPSPRSKTVNGAVVRNYTLDPYAGYDRNRRIGIDGTLDDDRLHPKALVLGVDIGGASRAYPFERVSDEGVVTDTLGGRPLVVAVTPGRAMVAYDRTVDGRVLRFDRGGEGYLRAGGSRWRLSTGVAVDGPHEGTTLARVSDTSAMFWFAWVKTHPGTSVYG